MQITGPAAAGDGLIQNRPALHLLHVLAKISDGQLLRNRNLALVGIFLSHHHAKESRLSGSVRAGEPDLLPRVQLKRSVDKHQLFAVLLMDIRKRDHPEFCPPSVRGKRARLDEREFTSGRESLFPLDHVVALARYASFRYS